MDNYAYNWNLNSEAVEDVKREQAAARHSKAQAYFHVFVNDKLGQKILADWVQEFCTGNPPGPDASEREVGMVDGKRQLVKMILDQISAATGANNE